jgi:D-3-phosphoglycerate dehydrogenase
MTFRVVLSDDKTVDSRHQTEILEALGADLTTLDEKTPTAVADAAREADALIVDAGTPVTAKVFDGPETLQVVGRSGIGVDNIDVDAAAANDVTVVNVPSYSLDEVSTHAVSLLLACVRAVPQFDREVRDGNWDWRTAQPLHRMANRTLGLVGFGSIARRLAAKLRTFGVEIIATDPYVSAATMRDYGVEKVPFDALLDRVAYLSIHTPLFEDTRALFSTAEFEKLSDDCIVVNTARGPVVDEAALVDALERGEIARAGLDVLETEPPTADNPLLDRDDVVLTPHTAWYSEESREDLSEGVASGVAAVLRGEDHEGIIDPETPWV